MATVDRLATISNKPANHWSRAATLPTEVTDRLEADANRIAAIMTRRITASVAMPPDFSKIGDLRSVLRACRDALHTLIRLLHDGRGLRAGDLDRLGSMGAQQAEMEVPLEVLLSAYRLAAKVVWEQVTAALATEVDIALPPSAVFGMAEQVLTYLDDISGAVGAAYLQTRERRVRERDRDRDRVLQRLLGGDASPQLRRQALAVDLDLSQPFRVVAGIVLDRDEASEHNLDGLWRELGGLSTAEHRGSWISLLPAGADLPSAWQRFDRAAGGSGNPAQPAIALGVGPVAQSVEEIAGAAERARGALRVGLKLHPGEPFHLDDEVGIFTALAADLPALRRYASHVLGQLGEHAEARDLELRLTLEALLAQPSLGDAAATLGVHRHTVVYRLRRLRELGVDPNIPGQRPRLWLALQALRLLGADEQSPADDGE